MTSKSAKRITFWAVLLLFGASALWWCFWFPFSAARVYRAVPVNFRYLSRHSSLADRWRDMIGHRVTAVVAEANGVTPDQLEAVRENETVDALVSLLANRETVIGFVPFLAGSGRPAWILSSWVGARGRLLDRWFLGRAVPGMQRVTTAGGHRIWSAPLGDSELGGHLSVAVFEGVCLACVSDDPEAVAFLVERAKGALPVAEQLGEGLLASSSGGASVNDDEGWLRWEHVGGTATRVSEVHFGVFADSPDVLSGWVAGEARIPRPRLGQMQPSCPLPGPRPAAWLVMPAGGVAPWLRGYPLPEAMQELLDKANEQAIPESPFFLAVYGDEYSGRILGFRTPTLACGWQVKEPEQVNEFIVMTLDRLSRAYGWTLIPRYEQEEDYVIVGINGTQGGIYATLPPEEVVAIGIRDNWVIVASNMRALKRMLEMGESTSWSESRAPNENLQRVLRGDEASVFVQADMPGTCASLRNAVAVYSLMLLAKPGEESRQRRAELAELRDVLRRCETLGELSAWLGHAGGRSKVYFEIRP